MQIVESTRVASLAFLIYEICITLDQEIGLIWTKPNKHWLKWQYLFARYFALAALLANRSIEISAPIHRELLPPSLRKWFACQVIVGSALMISVELVLMARVYALYSHSLYVACTLGALLTCEVISIIAGVVLNMLRTGFGADNAMVSSPDSFVYFGITVIVSQIVMLVLTLLKYNFVVKACCGNITIVTRVFKDGVIASAIILFVITWTLLSAMSDRYASIVDSWFLSVVSCAGCRLVINIYQFPRRDSESQVLTTCLESDSGSLSLELDLY